MARVDPIDKHYKTPDFLDIMSNILFYLLATVAIAIALIQKKDLKEFASIAFVAMVVIYFIVKHLSALFLMPNAERLRRKQLLSDSFSVPLLHESTQEYYNNSVSPSCQRLGANIFESTFFSHRILAKMLVSERIKLVAFFTIWIIALAYRGLSQEIIIIISQTLFSAEIIARWINMELLKARVCEAYNDLYRYFLTRPSNVSESTALILESFSHYESAKAAATIRLSSKIFNEVNSELSDEWLRIKQELKIDESINP